MPATELHFSITRGLRFLGFSGICLDAAGAPVVFNAGTTAQIVARRGPDKPPAFTMDVSFGSDPGEIIIEPIGAETTPFLPLGVFQHGLIITDSEEQSTGPHCVGTITIHRSFSA